MRYLSIKNLAKHQHYKNRNPPWIKLHQSVLSDYAFGCLQDASKAHLVLLWLLASRLDNKIPYDLPWIQNQLGITSTPDVEELVLHGFVEVVQDDSVTLAPRKQVADIEGEESRGRVETEKSTTSDSGESANGKRKKPQPEKPPSWVAEGVEWWVQNVGATNHGRFGKALTEAVRAWKWPEVFEALKCYVEDANARNKTPKPEWFAAEIIHWLKWAQMPATDEKGLPTPRARAIDREFKQ